MIEWLRRNPFTEAQPSPPPSLQINGRAIPVIIRRNARAKQMTLRLAADGSEVRMTIPRWGRPSEALAFAKEKSSWIADRLAQVPAPNPPAAGGTLMVQGFPVTLRWEESLPRKPKLVRLPATADQPHAAALEIGGPDHTLQPRLQRWLESRALDLFAADLVHYCTLAKVPVPQLRLSRAKRRWGSCSADGSIRVNWRLVQAPDAVRRSVIAHEVAHLTYFDHSPRFYAHLNALYEGDLAAADAWLKAKGRSLYAAFG